MSRLRRAEREADAAAQQAAERAAAHVQRQVDTGAIKVAILAFALAARVPGPLQALRAEADDRGHVGVVVGLNGRTWPLVTTAWPAFSVRIEPSSARWIGPVTSTCATEVERAIAPWAS